MPETSEKNTKHNSYRRKKKRKRRAKAEGVTQA